MPVTTLSAERLRGLLPVALSDSALDDLLFLSKAEIEEREGDELRLSATPDRLDLLSEAGLSLYLGGASGGATGLLRPAEDAADSTLSIAVDPPVESLRPYLAALVVRAPSPAGVDEGTLEEAIRFQELLHATVGRNRRAASLGIYPLERLRPPFRYALEPMSSVRFVPLDATEEVTASRFYAEHPMAAQYGAYGRSADRCLTLRDSEGTVLSLPPVLNGRAGGEARPGDRALVLESTGTRPRAVREALGLLQVVFLARGWTPTAVAIQGPTPPISDGTEVFRPRAVDLPSSVLREVSGEAIPSGDVEHRLAAARLSGRPHPGGWRVEVPPWRPDLTTAVDLVEEVVLSGGVRPESGLLLPSATRGRRRSESRFRARIGRWLLGLGLAQPYTPLLVGESIVRDTGATGAIRLQNPVSAEYAFLRDRLLLSHLEVLGRNTRHSYPQRFAEVGPVLVRSTEAEAGAATRYHASAVLAGESAGFADAAAVVEYVLRSLDVSSVREPAELPGTVAGRSARVRVAGETVAELGEIHPSVLTSLGVPVPACWAELDLSALWLLVRRGQTD
jgi:phenylalanyl-tRNA synthetase beta chain